MLIKDRKHLLKKRSSKITFRASEGFNIHHIAYRRTRLVLDMPDCVIIFHLFSAQFSKFYLQFARKK